MCLSYIKWSFTSIKKIKNTDKIYHKIIISYQIRSEINLFENANE